MLGLLLCTHIDLIRPQLYVLLAIRQGWMAPVREKRREDCLLSFALVAFYYTSLSIA